MSEAGSVYRVKVNEHVWMCADSEVAARSLMQTAASCLIANSRDLYMWRDCDGNCVVGELRRDHPLALPIRTPLYEIAVVRSDR